MAFKIISIMLLAIIAHISSAIPLEPLTDLGHNRIVGGENAEEGLAPYMVALVSGYTILSLSCGGSAVGSRYVLTAAHCITPFVTWNGHLMETLVGVVGSNQWNARDNVVHFSDYINHPEYDSVIIKNDVGLLLLKQELQLSELVAAIPLKYDWVDGGVESFATGFGRMWTWGPIPNDLQVLHLRTISGQECIDGIAQASQEWGWAPPVHPEVEICTFHSVNHGMCNGDSGSALVEKSSGAQIGIVSWGFACARGAPDVFARISGFKNFLEPILSGHHSN